MQLEYFKMKSSINASLKDIKARAAVLPTPTTFAQTSASWMAWRHIAITHFVLGYYIPPSSSVITWSDRRRPAVEHANIIPPEKKENDVNDISFSIMERYVQVCLMHIFRSL
jgi:hypothetical protein